MKYTTEEMHTLLTDAYTIRKTAREMVKQVLTEVGGTIEFDWDGGAAPCINSGAFEDDVTDCYIYKIYLDGDLIRADLHAYYLNDDVESIDLADEPNTDWIDILDYCLEVA